MIVAPFWEDYWILLFTVGSAYVCVCVCVYYIYTHTHTRRLGLYIFLGKIQYSGLSCKLTNRICFLLRYFLPLDMDFSRMFIYFFSIFIRKGRNRNSSEELRIQGQLCSYNGPRCGETSRLRNLSFTKCGLLVQFGA